MNLDPKYLLVVHVVSTIRNTSSQVQQKDQGFEKPNFLLTEHEFDPKSTCTRSKWCQPIESQLVRYSTREFKEEK